MDESSFRNRADEYVLGDRRIPIKPVVPMMLGDETYINVLCQRYLKVVHVKNPIFEVSKFNMHVKKVVEHGLDWDEDSCVVVSIFAHLSEVMETMYWHANLRRCSHAPLPAL